MSNNLWRNANRRSFWIAPLWFFVAGCGVGEIDGVVHGDRDGDLLVLEGDALTVELDTSPVHQAQEPFARIGAVWDAERAEAVEISVSIDGVDWTEFAPLAVHHIELERSTSFVGQLGASATPDDELYEYFRLRRGVGEASYLRLELLSTALEDSLEDSTDEQVSTLAAITGVEIGSRSSWNARSTKCSSPLGDAYRMAIHHTYTPTNDSLSPQARLRQIQSYHMDVRGWCDIGYHYLMSRDGRLWEGRPGHLRGAHAGGANTGNVGISVMGTHESTPITSTQMDSISALVAAVADEHDITINRTQIKGHREYKPTGCPGDALFAQLGTLVDMAADGGGPGPGGGGPATVTVIGVVYEGANTSDRIEGATVTLGSQTVTTNSVGKWQFDNVPAGSFTVTATAPGFAPRTVNGQTYGAESWSSFGMSPMSVESGDAILQGVVYRTANSSVRVPFATVTLSSGHSVTASSSGYYYLADLPAGPVTVTASAAGYPTKSVSRNLVDGYAEWGSVRLE